MPHAEESDCREELRRAGLSSHRTLARLLALLRAAPDTHLGLAEVVRMAAETGLAATPVELARQLETLADHRLLGRLPTTAAEPVFDTVPEPHAHLVYEQPTQIVDLHVSPVTLFAILRQALAEWPDGVEILVRFRANPAPPASPSVRRTHVASGNSSAPSSSSRVPSSEFRVPGTVYLIDSLPLI